MRKKKTTAIVAIAFLLFENNKSGRNGSGFNKMRPWPLLFGWDEEAGGLRDDAVAPTNHLRSCWKHKKQKSSPSIGTAIIGHGQTSQKIRVVGIRRVCPEFVGQ